LPDADRLDTAYVVLKLPLGLVLIWFALTVDPSQPRLGSVGRLAGEPPGSEHSMTSSPDGSAECDGNPEPVTTAAPPSARDDPAMFTTVTLGPELALAEPAKGIEIPEPTTAKAAPMTASRVFFRIER